MKKTSSQFEESLEQLLQAVPIPERTDHAAELRTRVLNDYRERQARHAEPKSSFMNLFLKRVFIATGGAAAVFILGAVLYSQPVVQTQVAKLRGTENNPTSVNSIITQLSPQEVLADSMAATINELNDTSKAHFVHMKDSFYNADQTLERTTETKSWKQGLDTRSEVEVKSHRSDSLGAGIYTALQQYEEGGSVWDCFVDTTGAISGVGYDNNSGLCYRYSATSKNTTYNSQRYEAPTNLELTVVNTFATKRQFNDGVSIPEVFMTIQVPQPLPDATTIAVVNADAADNGSATSNDTFFIQPEGLLEGEYNAKLVDGKYEYRLVFQEAYDQRKDAPIGAPTTTDTRRNYFQFLDGDTQSAIYEVNIDTGALRTLTPGEVVKLKTAQAVYIQQERQALAGATTAGNTYNLFTSLQEIYDNAQRGTIIKSDMIEKDGKQLLQVTYRYEDKPLPAWDDTMVQKMKVEQPYHEVIATIDPERKQVLKIETVALKWEPQSSVIEIIESTSVSPEESAQLLGPNKFDKDTWKSDTAALYKKFYPEQSALKIEDKESGY